ncbi:UROD/MetE-like protein [Annulohypoxylon maeteangense]|uniref:UROD/MetE-like protein n=1 Tax=Annulohypoxylon maeteangense TaxID=1927788 RepID=UPI0020081265|nr:UROD/MetE-like protein [Annulohypoxylon maeteangense]KAI0888217.1 UROD/MetE-like protein [Annulohypoxylon maeteangense]
MAPPFRADHIGSLLRPQSLLEARKCLSSPSQMYSLDIPQSVKDAELQAISEVVQEQLRKGIRPITDGEYARHIYYGGFFEKLSGFEAKPDLPIPDAFRTDFPTTTGLAKMGAKTRAAVMCTGKIEYKESPYLSEWLELRGNLPKESWSQAKFTIPAPNYQHIQLKPGTAWTKDSGYSSDQEYFDDLAKCYAAELQSLYDAGLCNIQVDDPHLTYFCSSQFLEGCKKDGTDTDELLDLYTRTHNQLLANKPADLHAGMHLCRGNMSGSTHWVSGSYEKIAYKLFNETDYQTYYLEFDDLERAGGFEPLRFLPKGKNVVLGLVSTKTPELEDASAIKERVFAAAEVIAKAQGISKEEAIGCLAISPQCGFSSSSLAGGIGMTMETMWDKLELVRDVARDIWG